MTASMRHTLIVLVLAGAVLGANARAIQRQQPVSARLGRGAVMPILAPRQTIPSLADVPSAVQGALQIEAVVGTAGRVQHTFVVSTPDATGALARSAVAAVQSWKFTPAIDAGGTPVATLVRIDFDIQPAPVPPGTSRVSVRMVEVSRDVLPDSPEVWADAKEVGKGMQVPRVIREITPSYTPNAMRAMIMGTVTMDVRINSDGTVGGARVTRSLDRGGLDQEALIAARYWLFEPARVNGTPVPSKVNLELQFRLH